MAEFTRIVIGLAVLLVSISGFVASRHMIKLTPRLRRELRSVPVKDGLLAPPASRPIPSSLRGGPVITKSGKVRTKFVLSGDRIRAPH